MQLSSIYILNHFLFKTPQEINFGGKNFYYFNVNEDLRKISITVAENDRYIPVFWNEIKNISAIVGANGVGKTNILKIINDSDRGGGTLCVFIYEKIEENGNIRIYVDNKTGVLGSEYEIEFSDNVNYEDYQSNSVIPLYYSPIHDRAISSFKSYLLLDANNLVDIFSKTLLSQVIFLNSPVSTSIKEIYSDFPMYKSLHVIAKGISKEGFTGVSTGNKKIEDLTSIIKNDLKEGKIKKQKSKLKNYLSILEKEDLYTLLQKLWNLPQYKNDLGWQSYLIHNSDNFIKNIEITLLSYLTLLDAFSVSNNTSIGFDLILSSSSFEEFLNNFLKKNIVNQHIIFRNNIDDITIENSENLIELVRSTYEKIKEEYDLDVAYTIKKTIENIRGIQKVLEFYQFITKAQKVKSAKSLDFFTDDLSVIESTQTFFSLYSQVIKYFSNVPNLPADFLEIKTDINLSYGENNLLNLYSILFNFINSRNYSKYKSYLLLLDEADLGYHPLWKIKYIDTINRTLNLMFSKVEALTNLQIIFTTHDPLTLSDLPNYNIVYLNKDQGNNYVLKINDFKRPTKTFGGNVIDLLANSFFIHKGIIGDFAKNKINTLIESLNYYLNLKDKDNLNITVKESERLLQMINIVDEPIIKNKLTEMYNLIFQENSIQNEIQELETRIKYLKEQQKNRND